MYRDRKETSLSTFRAYDTICRIEPLNLLSRSGNRHKTPTMGKTEGDEKGGEGKGREGKGGREGGREGGAGATPPSGAQVQLFYAIIMLIHQMVNSVRRAKATLCMAIVIQPISCARNVLVESKTAQVEGRWPDTFPSCSCRRNSQLSRPTFLTAELLKTSI